jgi:hypothetical protein
LRRASGSHFINPNVGRKVSGQIPDLGQIFIPDFGGNFHPTYIPTWCPVNTVHICINLQFGWKDFGQFFSLNSGQIFILEFWEVN